MKIQSIRPLLSGCLLWLGVSVVADQQTAVAQCTRPDGPTLRQLAEARGFHIGANFPNLFQFWREEGKFGPRRFDPEAAIAKDHFTIMTAGWESFPGHTWKGEGVYDFDGTDRYIAWCKENGILFHAHGLGYVFRAGWPFGAMIYGMAKYCRLPMMPMIPLNRMTGEVMGMATCRTLCHHVAPSRSATSYRCTGTS